MIIIVMGTFLFNGYWTKLWIFDERTIESMKHSEPFPPPNYSRLLQLTSNFQSNSQPPIKLIFSLCSWDINVIVHRGGGRQPIDLINYTLMAFHGKRWIDIAPQNNMNQINTQTRIIIPCNWPTVEGRGITHGVLVCFSSSVSFCENWTTVHRFQLFSSTRFHHYPSFCFSFTRANIYYTILKILKQQMYGLVVNFVPNSNKRKWSWKKTNKTASLSSPNNSLLLSTLMVLGESGRGVDPTSCFVKGGKEWIGEKLWRFLQDTFSVFSHSGNYHSFRAFCIVYLFFLSLSFYSYATHAWL